MKKNRKQKAQQAVAAVVMGMNLVNTMSPLALAVQMPMQPVQDNMPVPEAKPLEYMSLPQTLQAVEGVVFGKAEAAEIIVGSGENYSSRITLGGTMIVQSGGSALITAISGGTQIIEFGGSALATFGSANGTQIVEGGTGRLVYANNFGTQIINSGSGTITDLEENGIQIVNSGSGYVARLSSGGTQVVNDGVASAMSITSGGLQIVNGGTGSAGGMGGGTQIVSNGFGAYKETFSGGGTQIVEGGFGFASNLHYGTQIVNGGTGGGSALSGGLQIVNGGTATLSLNGGTQIINSGNFGSATVENGGTQNILSGAEGDIYTMSKGGVQNIHAGASGIVSRMLQSAGVQNIYGDGTGSVKRMSGGTQIIHDADGYGSVLEMYSGEQIVSNGSGNITTISGGAKQIIYNGSGYISTLKLNGQQIINNGFGHVRYMDSAVQDIKEGGTGTVENLSVDGSQIVNGGIAKDTNINGGKQIVNDGTATNTTVNKGVQIINDGNVTDTTVNVNGSQIITNGTVDKTVVEGGRQIIEGGNVNNNTLNSGLVHYKNAGAIVNEMVMTGGEMLLNADNGTYKIADLNFTGGTIDMTKVPDDVQVKHTYETLEIDKLSGNGGTFKLNTDLASETDGDFIHVKASDEGTTAYVQVSDASLFNNTMVTGDKKLLIATDDSGNAGLIGKVTVIGQELNNGGLWEVTPIITNGEKLGLNHNDWYLTTFTKEVNNDTQVLLDSTDNAYAMWRNTNDSLRKRLGELHMLPKNPDTDGVWARYIGGEFEGQGFEGQYNLYQLGYDKTYNEKSIYGFALEKGGGNATYEFGSGEDDLFAGSLYGTWLADDGSYTDLVAKIGRFDTEVNSYGDFPDSADYSHNAYSLSIEYGKNIKLNEHGTYIEPQVQFIAGRLDTMDYTTDRGQKVRVDGVNSYIGRVGFMIGQHTPDGNDVYFKANMLHEFGGEGSINMLAANGEVLSMDKDYGDTWFELGIGTNIKLGHASYFYGDIERGFSGDIDKKWQINAGLRFEF